MSARRFIAAAALLAALMALPAASQTVRGPPTAGVAARAAPAA
ncbi:MAG: hypothetical protein JWR84_2607, partial [Caulobacter sp.]|nr:hypothetical protein [Caulobacter sp.]